MTELPDLMRKNFGTGAREFRKTAVDINQDTSGWTDTPSDRAAKAEGRVTGKPVARVTDAPIDSSRVSSRYSIDINASASRITPLRSAVPAL